MPSAFTEQAIIGNIHLNGKSHVAEISRDIALRRKIYVMMIPCDITEMNTLEKYYIDKYNAMDSYNKTAGGSRIRK